MAMWGHARKSLALAAEVLSSSQVRPTLLIATGEYRLIHLRRRSTNSQLSTGECSLPRRLSEFALPCTGSSHTTLGVAGTVVPENCKSAEQQLQPLPRRASVRPTRGTGHGTSCAIRWRAARLAVRAKVRQFLTIRVTHWPAPAR